LPSLLFAVLLLLLLPTLLPSISTLVSPSLLLLPSLLFLSGDSWLRMPPASGECPHLQFLHVSEYTRMSETGRGKGLGGGRAIQKEILAVIPQHSRVCRHAKGKNMATTHPHTYTRTTHPCTSHLLKAARMTSGL